MCNNCIHKVVCHTYETTGGHISKCEHFKEEKRGRWIDNGCSNCGVNFTVNVNGEDVKLTDINTNFCPNCGADMKEE